MGKKKEGPILESATGIDSYHRHIRKKQLILSGITILILLLIFISVNAGATKIGIWDTFQAFIGQGDEKSSLVFWKIRMPRVTAALVAGIGLAISGCVMQNTLRNPLASPSTLGISGAAVFGANIAIILLDVGNVLSTVNDAVAINNPYIVTICAFASAMVAIIVILSLAKLRGFSPESIVLAGVALGSIFGAGTTLIQYFATDIKIAAAIFWTFGDLGRASWQEIGIMSVVVVISMMYFLFQRWNYNALANGEETARGLGVNTDRVRFWGLFMSALITAVTVSFLGMISFIGLIAPQIMRRIIGEDHRFLIPASALAGAAVLLISDTIARTWISPVVLPVGAITSLLGGPMFLYILIKGKLR